MLALAHFALFCMGLYLVLTVVYAVFETPIKWLLDHFEKTVVTRPKLW